MLLFHTKVNFHHHHPLTDARVNTMVRMHKERFPRDWERRKMDSKYDSESDRFDEHSETPLRKYIGSESTPDFFLEGSDDEE
ncbi:hypothetical protein PV325_005108 [Microctonus aethiopoides]|nr:hypothetical protein PV325_005108 [Microctonus aethiopoides]